MGRSKAAATGTPAPLRVSPRKRNVAGSIVNNAEGNDLAKASGISTLNTDTPRKRRKVETVTNTTTSSRESKFDLAFNGSDTSRAKKVKNSSKRKVEEIAKIAIVEPVINKIENTSPDSQIKSNSDIEKSSKAVRKRKTKEEKEAEAMPLAARTIGHKMYVGAHVSIAKGVENAVTNAVHIGGNAFALFLKSQRKWENPPLKAENRDLFLKACNDHKFDAMSHVVPHGSYLVNLATPDKEKAKQAYSAFVDDLHRCEALGIKYYNFHPGSTNQEPLDEAIGRIASNLNRALSETTTVTPLLENMAGKGSIIGSRFADLRDIIAGIRPEFKSRIGICIDTCHTFAAGYDLQSPEAFKGTLKELDEIVGLQYLKALHLNDSKAPFESHRDLHQNIGVGFLGLRAFHNIMNEPRLHGLPMVLETPCDRPDPSDPTGKRTTDDKTVWAREIKLLESLTGMDPESTEFKRLEKELGDQGRAERLKMETSIAATEEKKRKKVGKGQKSISDLFGSIAVEN